MPIAIEDEGVTHVILAYFVEYKMELVLGRSDMDFGAWGLTFIYYFLPHSLSQPPLW